MIRQKTILNAVSDSGIGLHKGQRVDITLKSAEENTGIIFRRVDLDPVVEFSMDPTSVGDTQMCTCLINAQGERLSTTEHLVAAVAGLGIDNLIVEVNAGEIPIMDGSSLPFVMMIKEAGICYQASPKQFIQVKKTIRVEDGDKWAELRPSKEGFKVDFTIDFEHPAIASTQQNYVVDITPNTFMKEIQSARTFGFMKDIEYLHANNLALGASMDNAVALDDFKVVNPHGLRVADEFVKHKILDAVGDLFMSGKSILGDFVAYKSGHGLNNKLLCELLSQADAWEIVTLDAPEEEIDGFTIPSLA